MEISKIIRWVRQLITDQLKLNGANVFEYDIDNAFRISEDFPVESSINVYKNGTLLDSADWTYNSDTNRVTVDPLDTGNSLVKEDVIEITYNYYCKFSDAEISGYIESSLLFFVEFRYEKVFEVDDEDTPTTINAINNIDPTKEEGYLIALVTAILINPDNQTIRTPDITISGKQLKSKKAQISETLTRFTKIRPNIEFLED